MLGITSGQSSSGISGMVKASITGWSLDYGIFCASRSAKFRPETPSGSNQKDLKPKSDNGQDDVNIMNWSAVWKMEVPLRIQLFLWKAIQNESPPIITFGAGTPTLTPCALDAVKKMRPQHMPSFFVRKYTFSGFDSSRAADSEEAEAVAMIRGMEAVMGRGMERVMVLTDFRRLVSAFETGSTDLSWGALTLAPEILFLVARFHEFRFQFINRCFNFEAHALAALGSCSHAVLLFEPITTLEERLDGFTDDQTHMGERLITLKGVVAGNMVTFLIDQVAELSLKVDNRNSSASKRARTDGSRREDDWTCPSCGNVNFSFRTTCNKHSCTQSRPADHNSKNSAKLLQAPQGYSSPAAYLGSSVPSSMYLAVPPYGPSLFNGPSLPPYNLSFSGGSGYHYDYGNRLSAGSPYGQLHLSGPSQYGSGSMMAGGMYSMPPVMDRYGMVLPMGHAAMGARPVVFAEQNLPKKSGEGTRDNDWTCPKCGNVNFSFRTVCNMRKCNTPKPGSQASKSDKNSKQRMPEGSWKCEQCDNMNYPFRTKCNRQNCGADKPSEGNGSPEAAATTSEEDEQVLQPCSLLPRFQTVIWVEIAKLGYAGDLMYFPSRNDFCLSSVAGNMEELSALQHEFENVKDRMDDETNKAQCLEHKINLMVIRYGIEN
ncbi:hypothetical protein GIB67_009844 [Kingdonia uniflora]|uniref:RanBP2-type domain-containing protein n=2 Tax=Magnoliopsida TaxID=3398 RepID=A0A7J7LMK4_9MAGN|nr:hypothetical protein GIB67_009844 [Kingdonia uniflora]